MYDWQSGVLQSQVTMTGLLAEAKQKAGSGSTLTIFWAMLTRRRRENRWFVSAFENHLIKVCKSWLGIPVFCVLVLNKWIINKRINGSNYYIILNILLIK